MLFLHLTIRSIQNQLWLFFAWVASLVILAISVLALWKPLNNSGALNNLTVGIPEEVAKPMGLVDMSSPGGYLNGNLFAVILPLLISFVGISTISAQFSEAERLGRFELAFSLPIDRKTIALSRLLGILSLLFACSMSVYVTIVVGVLTLDMDVSIGNLTSACLGLFLLGVLHASLGYFAYGVRGEKGAVLGASYMLLIVGYFLYSIVPVVPKFGDVNFSSPWYWALGEDAILTGINLAGVGALILLSFTLIGVGSWALTRRDISTP